MMTMMMAMEAAHPLGETLELVGIEANERGRSCEEHKVCGSVLKEDTVVRLRHIQVKGDEEGAKPENTVGAFWVSDGIDRCLVGFLPRHMVKHSSKYNGRLAQVTEIYGDSDSPVKCRKHHRNKGVALIALVDYYQPPPTPSPSVATRKQATDGGTPPVETRKRKVN